MKIGARHFESGQTLAAREDFFVAWDASHTGLVTEPPPCALLPRIFRHGNLRRTLIEFIP
jgi:hypothetical protein